MLSRNHVQRKWFKRKEVSVPNAAERSSKAIIAKCPLDSVTRKILVTLAGVVLGAQGSIRKRKNELHRS